MLRAIGEVAVGTVGVLAELATIAASAVAIYIFVTKRTEIRAFVKAVSNFVHQNSLAELRVKLEKLNDMTVNEPADREEVIGLLHDVCGQIDGSPLLRSQLQEISGRIRLATTSRKVFTEPAKRALVSELRESLRHLDVIDYAEAIKEEGR